MAHPEKGLTVLPIYWTSSQSGIGRERGIEFTRAAAKRQRCAERPGIEIQSEVFSAMFDDVKIHVKIKIAALWASLMFCYIYCDYFELYKPGKLETMLQGKMVPLGPATQGALLGASLLMAIPSVMIFVSLVLSARVSRLTNLILGPIYSAIMLAIIAIPGVWVFYKFLGSVEVTLSLLIFWYAWTWPKQSDVARRP